MFRAVALLCKGIKLLRNRSGRKIPHHWCRSAARTASEGHPSVAAQHSAWDAGCWGAQPSLTASIPTCTPSSLEMCPHQPCEAVQDDLAHAKRGLQRQPAPLQLRGDGHQSPLPILPPDPVGGPSDEPMRRVPTQERHQVAVLCRGNRPRHLLCRIPKGPRKGQE